MFRFDWVTPRRSTQIVGLTSVKFYVCSPISEITIRLRGLYNLYSEWHPLSCRQNPPNKKTLSTVKKWQKPQGEWQRRDPPPRMDRCAIHAACTKQSSKVTLNTEFNDKISDTLLCLPNRLQAAWCGINFGMNLTIKFSLFSVAHGEFHSGRAWRNETFMVTVPLKVLWG